jgi:hypothetical protein
MVNDEETSLRTFEAASAPTSSSGTMKMMMKPPLNVVNGSAMIRRAPQPDRPSGRPLTPHAAPRRGSSGVTVRMKTAVMAIGCVSCSTNSTTAVRKRFSCVPYQSRRIVFISQPRQRWRYCLISGAAGWGKHARLARSLAAPVQTDGGYFIFR